MHVLLSFIGRSLADTRRAYQQVAYRFPDGSLSAPTPYLGWIVRERSAAQRMVILGTGSSMWEHLVESLDLGEQAEDVREQLIGACERGDVSQALLDQFAPLVSERLGLDVRLRVVPPGASASDQIAVLGEMASHVEEGAAVTLDVTHGFRHLPMLALMSALHLRAVRNAEIRALLYGQLVPGADSGQIIDLVGLLDIADWVIQLARYDHSGDYGVLAPLYEREGLPPEQARLLAQAAFFERSTNATRARECLNGFRAALDTVAQAPLGSLFAPALEKRLRWIRAATRSTREFALARAWLERGDALRSALYAREAYITQRVEAGPWKNPDDIALRNEAAQDFDHGKASVEVLDLRHIRNALAHGARPGRRDITKILADPCRLETRLGEILDNFEQHKEGS